MSIQISDWHGLYREGWGKRLRPASFAHPAKNSYGLSVRIYEHALEEGWIEPGDYLIDIFAGIGGFALEAMRHGLNFVGVELEQRFVDMGQGCDCTGISKADWVRFQGRWDEARYRDGRHWCPECIMKASIVTNEREFEPLPLPGTKWAAIAKARQTTLFDAVSSASYVRNSGEIPCTGAHRYHGNVETWERQGMPGTAIIVQGDSRRLGEVLARARLCLSSPPYAGTLRGNLNQSEGDKEHNISRGRNPDSPGAHYPHGYSPSPANLGNLPDTGFELALSSPPYAGSLGDGKSGIDWSKQADRKTAHPHGWDGEGYGQETGQLGAMPDTGFEAALSPPVHAGSLDNPSRKADYTGTGGPLHPIAPKKPARAVESPQNTQRTNGGVFSEAQEGAGQPVLTIGSPPYSPHGVGHDAGHPRLDATEDRRRSEEGSERRPAYGNEPGQLAQMPEGSLALTISSPPFQGSLSRDNVTAGRIALAREKGVSVHLVSPVDMEKIGKRTQNYNAADGQLAALPEGSHAEACERPTCAISSPPWEKSLAIDSQGFTPYTGPGHYQYSPEIASRRKQSYGNTASQLGQMPTGSHAEALEAGAETGRAQACISSPPFLGTLNSRDPETFSGLYRDPKFSQSKTMVGTYGHAEGQLGEADRSTFWAASREILEQVYQVLAPGAHAIWVLKMFVRSGRLVDFPGQWEALCQSVGFRTVCKHRAWLNKNTGIMQTTLDGEEVSMEKWYKSFFKRLCESKGSPRVDWELILCMVKEA